MAKKSIRKGRSQSFPPPKPNRNGNRREVVENGSDENLGSSDEEDLYASGSDIETQRQTKRVVSAQKSGPGVRKRTTIAAMILKTMKNKE